MIPEHPIYSPSRGGTQDFQTCPKRYDYTRRWEPFQAYRPEMILGNAVHASLASHYRQLGGVKDNFTPEWWLKQTLEEQWQDTVELDKGQAFKICQRAIKEALSIDLLGKTGKVLSVEQEMGPEQCHPDLVLGHGIVQGASLGQMTMLTHLEVIDWKFSLNLDMQYVSKRLQSYETLWQLRHYAWRVQQEYGLPCKKVSIVQMADKPKSFARLVSYEITPELITAWEQSARHWWRWMTECRETGEFPMNFEGCLKYGGCPFYSGCHVLTGDEEKFDTLYQRKKTG